LRNEKCISASSDARTRRIEIMINGLFQTTTVPMLEQVLNFSQSRHNVLAGNIANLDTPGYQAQDLSPEMFAQQLQSLVASRHSGSSQDYAANLDKMQAELSGQAHGMSQPGQLLRHDLGNVSLEQQIAELTKNQMQHNLAISIMSSQFRLLQAAISERV
jgi:flagellar basal-body rod protein FlgB